MEIQARKEEDIAAQTERLTTLRESTGELLGLVGETRVRIREVPDLLREALSPLDGTVIGLDERLDRVLRRSEALVDATHGASPNGSSGAETVVHIPDDGEASLYEPAAPAPPVPVDEMD